MTDEAIAAFWTEQQALFVAGKRRNYPTVRDVAKFMGVSVSSAWMKLSVLEAKKLIGGIQRRPR